MLNDQKGEADDQGAAYDCADCGACCRCYPIFASQADAEREPLIETKAVRCEDFLGEEGRIAFRLYPLLNAEGCAFLGEDQLCRIYASRPEICRQFEPGSDQCVRARQRVGVGAKRRV